MNVVKGRKQAANCQYSSFSGWVYIVCFQKSCISCFGLVLCGCHKHLFLTGTTLLSRAWSSITLSIWKVIDVAHTQGILRERHATSRYTSCKVKAADLPGWWWWSAERWGAGRGVQGARGEIADPGYPRARCHWHCVWRDGWNGNNMLKILIL